MYALFKSQNVNNVILVIVAQRSMYHEYVYSKNNQVLD